MSTVAPVYNISDHRPASVQSAPRFSVRRTRRPSGWTPNSSPAYLMARGRLSPTPNASFEQVSLKWSAPLRSAIVALTASTCWMVLTAYIWIYR